MGVLSDEGGEAVDELARALDGKHVPRAGHDDGAAVGQRRGQPPGHLRGGPGSSLAGHGQGGHGDRGQVRADLGVRRGEHAVAVQVATRVVGQQGRPGAAHPAPGRRRCRRTSAAARPRRSPRSPPAAVRSRPSTAARSSAVRSAHRADRRQGGHQLGTVQRPGAGRPARPARSRPGASRAGSRAATPSARSARVMPAAPAGCVPWPGRSGVSTVDTGRPAARRRAATWCGPAPRRAAARSGRLAHGAALPTARSTAAPGAAGGGPGPRRPGR